MLVGEILTHHARVRPGASALVDGATRLTYRELNALANQLANGLRRLGVARGDRVVVLAPNSLDLVLAYWAVPKLGAIVVPLNYWLQVPELAGVLEDCAPKVLIATGEYAGAARSLQAKAPSIEALLLREPPEAESEVDIGRLLASQPTAEPEPPAMGPDEDALLIYSSGTTGRPKGVVHTHGSLARTAATMVLELGLRRGDIAAIFLPLFTAYLETLLPMTYAGACSILLKRFEPPALLEMVQGERISVFDNIPTTMQLLLEAPELPRYDLRSLRMVYYASAPMPPPLIRRWVERFPAIETIQFYGMTEYLCIALQESADQIRKLGTVGREMIGTQVAIVSEEGDPLPVGATGEAACRGGYRMRGYWGDPLATERVARGDWLLTGDLGHLDEDGYLTLEGRKKEIIISGGMNISPVEVENVLHQHPDILEAAVIGVPHGRWGEAVHAVIVARAGARLTQDEVVEHCRRHLASYKKPVSVDFVEALPRTGIGKVARNTLVETYRSSRAGP